MAFVPCVVSPSAKHGRGNMTPLSLDRSTERVDGLGEVLRGGRYDALLLDQFGVLHNGQHAYRGAVECIRQAHAAGLKIVIVSNTSRRAGGCAEKLVKYGFEKDWFTAAVTSGELAHQALTTDRQDKYGIPTGTAKVVHTNWLRRGSLTLSAPELRLTPVGESCDEADFVLCHGTEGITQPDGSVTPASLDALHAVLAKCVEQDLLLLCANPDVVTVDGSELILMPGTLAREYERRGGRVVRLGKPEACTYDEVCRLLDLTGDRSRLLAVGDSLEHDILGASRAGIDSVFIAGGIFAKDLDVDSHENKDWTYDEHELSALIETHAPGCPLPTYVMALCQW